MNRNEELLVEALNRLAAEDTSLPSPAIEAALLKRLKRKRWLGWPLFLEFAAAAAILLIALYPRPASAPEAEFVPVPYASPIAPGERIDLVRVNLPISALAQWGLPLLASANPYSRVDADVVIGEDSLPRAVRIVNLQ